MRDRVSLFGDRARERDFSNENDRFLHKNLHQTRFATERDFSNP